MSASDERIAQDLRKLSALEKETGGRVKLVGKSGTPVKSIELKLGYPTAPSRDYPEKVQSVTDLRIDFLSRYPFVEPAAIITTPIFHPNVFSSGKICLGTKWLPTQGLDLLVKRIIQIITFDANVLNEKSPANGAALDWYRTAIRTTPRCFPTSSRRER